MQRRITLKWIAALAIALLLSSPAARVAAAGAPPITVPFDHLSTGFELDGVHRDLPCESCHVNAIFKGTPRNCGVCHIAGSTFNATPKTATHIQSTNNCAACHDTTAFRPSVHFTHAEVMGSCVSCHNGTIAQGKGPAHPATSQVCEACHTVMSWNPPKVVDHAQIPLAAAGFCIICHNGVQATGKNKGHVLTNLECGDCHLTTTWLGANFDHTGIRSGCASCHNGTKAVGKQGSHMPTTDLCENCHTTGIGTAAPSWVPSKFDHTQMSVTTCQTCHSGSVKITTGFVSGQPSNHVPPIPSAIDCGICHGNNPAAETWTVLAASIPTLHTGLNVSNCVLCHGGQTFAGVPAPYIPMSISGVSPTKKTPLSPPHIPILAGADCSACHGAAYQAGGFGPATAMNAKKHTFVSTACDTCHDTGKSFYVGSGTPLQLRPANHLTSSDPRMATNDCSVCHTTTDWGSSALPAGHMPNPANLTCVKCHASAPTSYTLATLAPNSVLHTGISGNCGQCHGDNFTALTWFNNFTPKDALLTPNHIPYLSGTDCSSCHSSSTYAVGNFGPMNMTSAKHAFVPTSCDTCHEAGLSFYMGAANPALQGRPASHLSSGNPQEKTGDCSGCHNTADWNTTARPANHMPTPGTQTCSVCHTAIGSTAASYATLASIAVLHTGISGNCGQCHGAMAPLTWYNAYTPKDAVLAGVPHIPYLTGTDCSACHTANYVAGGFGPATAMSPAKHAFVPTTCDTCHDTGKNFFVGGGMALQLRPPTHISAPNPASQKTGDCSACHNTTDWNAPTALPNGHMPIPGTPVCTVCHTAAPANYNAYASIAILHTGISTGCAQCHGGAAPLTFYNNHDNPKAAPPNHIPSFPPFASNDCSACHTPNFAPGGFGPMNMTQATHANVSNLACKTCHEAGLSFYMGAASPGLQGRPANHTSSAMSAPNDCAGCHTTANWNSNAMPAGHMPNPANTACNVCHVAAPASYVTLAPNAVLHTGISGNCGQCHGGTAAALTWYNNFTPKAALLAPSHIPYLPGTDCGSCHASGSYAPGTFGPMNMTPAKHAFVTTNCVTCHEKGLSFYMGGASPALQGRPADHNSGQMATGNCSVCHTTANWSSNSGALPAGHMPNPASQGCAVCHVAAPANYATMAANPVLHTGISSGCSTCHGTTQKSFYNNNDPPKPMVANHIPSGATPCENCHAVAFTSFAGTTMSAAKHTLLLADTGGTCDQCHEIGKSFFGVGNLTVRPGPDHFAGQDCNGCHSTNGWGGGGAKKKAAGTATSKTGTVTTVISAPTAAQSGRRVGAPGTLRATGMAMPSHAGVTSSCASCHNAVLAQGKGSAHIASNNACENCHTTVAWLPARFDHRGISASCVSCHNGASATAKPARHVLTVQDCGSCHGTLAWRPATFNHVGISASCQSCHNGVTATAKQAQHVVTTLDCGTCHSTMNWTPTAQRPPLRPLLPRPRAATAGPAR
ncbi:MAG: hypothetical protein NVS9B2_01760 [Steroidobacteraceae bacterium]